MLLESTRRQGITRPMMLNIKALSHQWYALQWQVEILMHVDNGWALASNAAALS